MVVSVGVLIPLPLNGEGVGYTCSSIAQGMANDDVRVSVVTPRCRLSMPSVDVIEVLPRWARYAPYRWVSDRAARSLESAFLSRLAAFPSEGQAAYLWSNPSRETMAALRSHGATIVREQFNCHTGVAKAILDQAYRRLGAEPAHVIREQIIEDERRILDAVDYVFCPGPNVARSLTESGVDAAKLLPASYGWDPLRLATKGRAIEPGVGITLLFVGSICVRKGAHLLLDYWARSGVRGRLVLAGAMEPVIKEKCARLLARDDVVVLGYSRDVGALYRSADAFVFPTLEEGSPLVVYEACGAGLPVVTTEMGAGGFLRRDREGFVLDAYDAPGWIAAIRQLEEDVALRQRLSDAARLRADAYVWPEVAARRRSQIEGLFADPIASRPLDCVPEAASRAV